MHHNIAHQVIHIISGKGGVGKTTITAGLGALLSLQGLRVLMIDADFGLRNLDLIFHLQDRLVFDLGQLLEKKVALDEALIPVPHLENLFLITSSLQKGFDDLVSPDIAGFIEHCRARFDVILLDHGAGFAHDVQQFVQHGDAALLISQPHNASLRSVNKILGALEQQMPCYWLINRWGRSARSNRYMLEQIAQIDFPVTTTIDDIGGLDALRLDQKSLSHAPAQPLIYGLKPLVQQWLGEVTAQGGDLEALLSFESRGLFPLNKRGKIRFD